jgi:hypothetical protein
VGSEIHQRRHAEVLGIAHYPKSDTKTIAKIKTAIEAAYREGEAKLKGNGKTVPPLAALKTRSVMATPKDPMIPLTLTPNLSTPTARTHRAWWMQTVRKL